MIHPTALTSQKYRKDSMKKKRTLINLLGMALGLYSTCFLSGCSTVGHPPAETQKTLSLEVLRQQAKQSSIEIEYSLGHSHYRLSLLSQGEQVEAKNMRDKDLLGKASIESEPYFDYLQKTLQFVQQPQNLTVAAPQACRNPYRVTVKIVEKTFASEGCRSWDDGTLSKLVKEGEFLLYSKI